jgi:hypothetical protein
VLDVQGPPELGTALTISAIAMATKVVMKQTISQPLAMHAGPPVVSPYSNRVCFISFELA